MKVHFLLVVLLLGVVGGTAHGQGNTAAALLQPSPSAAIAYRKSVFNLIVWNFQPMSAMARGKLPFDARVFAMRARRVAQLAPQLQEGFPSGSQAGAETEALPAIWTDWPDFQQKLRTFETEARTLVTVAKGGDEAAIKRQFGQLAGSCKACHDQYKMD